MKYSKKDWRKGSALVWVLLPIILIIAAYYIFVNVQKTPTKSQDNLISMPEYVFSKEAPSSMTKVSLSHLNIRMESPWGVETDYKGSKEGGLGQYTFVDGTRMTVSVNKLNPRDEIKELGLSTSEAAEYNSVFDFIASKIGQDFSGYDYVRFLNMVTQQTVDKAISQQDKDGYSKILSLKDVTFLGDAYSFSNPHGKGFVWIRTGSDLPVFNIWGPNGWAYNFGFPSNQNITRAEIDAFMKSIEIL